MKKHTGNKRGYTLAELIAVIAIAAVLTAASTPFFSGYMRKIKSAQSLTECKTISLAAEAGCMKYRYDRKNKDSWKKQVEKEILTVTEKSVSVLEDEMELMDTEFGIIIGKTESGVQTCTHVICMIDGERWIFDSESGEMEPWER